jgi:DNA invertase Pin-like site-specific DNA recombinase
MKIISYLRVSTAEQGLSGLGLEAQRTAIENYAATRQANVLATFTEVESGKNNNRVELDKAIHLSRVTGATLVIAKLDRLSRNASFLLALRDSGIKFIASDMPDANELTVGIMALVAQQEREAISKRTKDALQEAKKRLAKEGKRLGNPNGAKALRRADKGNTASLQAIKQKADSHAIRLDSVIKDLAENGITSLGAIALELNKRGMTTPRGNGSIWHKSSVKNLLQRQAGASA